MQNIMKFSTRNWKLAVGLAALSVFVLFGAPRAYRSIVKADTVCPNAPQNASLNPYPVTFSNEPCHDWPALWAAKNGRYPANENELYAGYDLHEGDTLEVRAYIHNGTPSGGQAATGVKTTITVDGNYEPTHTIGASTVSDNAGSVSGSINIRTAADEKLEIVPDSARVQDWYGNPSGSASVTTSGGVPAVHANLGNLAGCFEKSKFVVFSVRVVKKPAPPVEKQASLTAEPKGELAGQCLFNGRITWSTTGYENVEVFVVDPNNGQEKLVAAAASGSNDTPWLNQNKNYVFRLKSNGQVLKEASIATGALSDPACNQQPPAVEKEAALTASLKGELAGQCLFNGRVEWTTKNYDNVQVFVVDPANGQEKLLSAAINGGADTPWLNANRTYTFRLKSNNQTLKEATITTGDLSDPSCKPQPPAGKEFTFSAQLKGELAGQCLFNGHIEWTTKNYDNVQVFVVDPNNGQEKLMAGSINGSADTPWLNENKTYVFRLKSNGQLLKEVSIATGALTDPACKETPPTPKTNNAMCVGISAPATVVPGETFNVTVTMRNNGTKPWTSAAHRLGSQNPQDNTRWGTGRVGLPFSPVNPGQDAAFTFSVTAPTAVGSYPFDWKMLEEFVQWFGDPCTKTIEVKAGHVSPLTCVASATNVRTGQPVTFTANGGEGNYSWTVNGTNTNTAAAAYTTSFPSAGTYNVRVTRGGQSADCPVVTVTNPPQTCVPNTNGSLAHGAITELANGKFSTIISYNFTGNNPVRVTYVDPASGQEVTFVASDTGPGSKLFANFDANKDYVFKLYDTSSCGGMIATVVVRKNVNTQCVPNTNVTFNITNVTKTGSTYSFVLNWSSTGSHQVKVAHNVTTNIMVTGPSTGTHTVTGAAAGSSHSFYLIDAECGTTLATAVVTIPAEPTQPNDDDGDHCFNNSCNNNTNNNTINGNNNNNVNNQTNINGNNNTVTNNNTCVNNSCNNVYYINNQGTTVPANEFRQLSIEKLVRVQNFGGSYQNNVNANNGEVVEFQITVRNTGQQAVQNVRVTDVLPSGLSFVSGTDMQNGYYVGNLTVNESRTLYFQARVNTGAGQSIQNIARATGDNASSVQDDAWVFTSGSVAGGNVNLTFAKRAFNDTKNIDATTQSANREDFITYTLTVTNTGNAPANAFVVTDDLSQVLPYADMVDNGGGSVSGNVITYPAITIPAGGSVSKSFKVRVKYYLAENLSYVMTNTYGNTVTVRINTPQVLGTFTAPRTGSDAGMAGLFGGILTSAFAAIKKRKVLMKLILAE